MNPTNKKLLSLFLIFSLVTINCASLRTIGGKKREKLGAKIIILKRDNQKIRGELIAVKKDSLLLLESESGADVSVYIKDIIEIRIKKSSFLKGAAKGAFIGVIAGGILDLLLIGSISMVEAFNGVFQGALFVGLFGGFIGLMEEAERIQIVGMSDSEIKETLDKLRKKARIHDNK